MKENGLFPYTASNVREKVSLWVLIVQTIEKPPKAFGQALGLVGF